MRTSSLHTGLVLTLSAGLALVAGQVCAQDREARPGGLPARTAPDTARRMPRPGERPPMPPPAAFEACRGRTSSAACTVTGPRGERITGRCGSPPGQPLACMPDRPPPPPPEALAACEDIAAGDACIVETPHGTLEGSCRELREGGTACVPNGPPPGRRRGEDAP